MEDLDRLLHNIHIVFRSFFRSTAKDPSSSQQELWLWRIKGINLLKLLIPPQGPITIVFTSAILVLFLWVLFSLIPSESNRLFLVLAYILHRRYDWRNPLKKTPDKSWMSPGFTMSEKKAPFFLIVRRVCVTLWQLSKNNLKANTRNPLNQVVGMQLTHHALRRRCRTEEAPGSRLKSLVTM